MQRIIEVKQSYSAIEEIFSSVGTKKYMLVYTNSAKRLPIWGYLMSLDIPCVFFNGFTPNPKYEECAEGVELFNREGCDTILAVGGGSALDVAKCIKLYCKMPKGSFYLEQEYTDTKIPFIGIPTTAGTGSESTPFSVIYYKGEKQSVHHHSIVPDYAILDGDLLESLPVYQKKCTMLDALCQAIESWWSVHSNEESIALAKEAVEIIIANWKEYIFVNAQRARDAIMRASNLAGQAIAITATTAPHAMSYKLTTVYGLPHGHSVAISLLRVWRYMLAHGEKCTDERGREYLFGVFNDIAKSMGCNSPENAVNYFEDILNAMDIEGPDSENKKSEAEYLASCVNVERLGNNPVALSGEVLCKLYGDILK